MSAEADAIKGMYFPVLDHGFVALVDYMGSDAAVVQAARVSYGAGTKTVNEDRGLLRYCMRLKHTTPFEMVELKFHVKLPIFVARQLIRHRTANVNEYSLRYSLAPMQFYMPSTDVMGKQNKRNKQGRAEPIELVHAHEICEQWRDLQRRSKELYELCISEDVDLARELARLHLPLSIYTEWYWKIDLHNLLGFLRLRCDGHAQWEIQETARVKAAISRLVAPKAFEAWIDYVFQSATFSRLEMQALRNMVQFDGSMLHPMASAADWEIGDKLGMSKREWDEFVVKFDVANNPGAYEPASFELDMSKAKTAEYFLEQAKSFLPISP